MTSLSRPFQPPKAIKFSIRGYTQICKSRKGMSSDNSESHVAGHVDPVRVVFVSTEVAPWYVLIHVHLFKMLRENN